MEIRKSDVSTWPLFRRYHYLDSNLHKGAKCYVGIINNQICAFIAILPFPHPKVRNMRRVHRLVVLPDYQGIGLGIRLMEFVGKIYLNIKKRFSIVTSTPALMHSLKDNKNWICKSISRKGPHITGSLAFKGSNNRITSSWEFIPE